MDMRIVALIGGCIIGASGIAYAVSNEPIVLDIAYATPAYCAQAPTEPAVLARSAYAFDAATGIVLFDKNADAQLPLASLTKIMTVLMARSVLTPTTTVQISKDALAADGEYGFKIGEAWTAEDLTDFTLIESANDGARALMLAAAAALHETPEEFLEGMNRRARAIGLSSTFFLNETGLDVSTSIAGAYGSARDIAHLMAYVSMHEPGIFEQSTDQTSTFVSLSGVVHKAENTSLVAGSLAASSASKTGYTDLAGGNLSLVFEPSPGHPIGIAVLGSSREGRDQDVRTIAQFATKEIKRQLLCNTQP